MYSFSGHKDSGNFSPGIRFPWGFTQLYQFKNLLGFILPVSARMKLRFLMPTKASVYSFMDGEVFLPPTCPMGDLPRRAGEDLIHRRTGNVVQSSQVTDLDVLLVVSGVYSLSGEECIWFFCGCSSSSTPPDPSQRYPVCVHNAIFFYSFEVESPTGS